MPTLQEVNSTFNRYKFYSEKAAKQERAGNFEQASANWSNAAVGALSQANHHWALARAAFCAKQAKLTA